MKMKCYICGHEVNPYDANIWYCEQCHLYGNQGAHFSDTVATENAHVLEDSLYPLRKYNFNRILKKIQKIFNKTKLQGLEIGCAKGWFMEQAFSYGIEMDGIEPNDTFYEECINKGLNVINGLFPQDFSLDKKYDFIIFNDVFEHIEDLNLTLEKCVSLLEDDGILIINAPSSGGILFHVSKFLNKFHLISFWRRLWQFDFYSPHIWYFNPENLSLLMRKYNFSQITECDLKSLSLQSLKQRITCSQNTALRGFFLYILIFLSFPVIKFFPNDILCAFYKKDKKKDKDF